MAKEQSVHFYRRDGSSCHTVPNKTRGGERPVRINDAKALNLFPSVTTVQKLLVAPQLEVWKQRQAVKFALNNVATKEQLEDNKFLDTFREMAFEQIDEAAEHGTRVHAALENYFSELPHDPAYDVYVNAVASRFDSEGIRVMQRELTLVNIDDGYAGKTDLLIDSPRGTGVGDYKNKKTIPGKSVEPYDGHSMQIAAYIQAQYGEIGSHVGFNAWVSSTEPGRVDITWYDSPELQSEWELFQHLCAIWRIRSKYDPRIIQ